MKQHILNYKAVPRETFDIVDELIDANRTTLNTYLEQLLWWNKRINLISRDVPRETIKEHIRHSLVLTQLNIYQECDYIIDSGTGGGLPGLPLATISCNKSFLLNDKVSKKILAVKQITREMNLKNVETRDAPVSEIHIENPFLLVSKHAFKIHKLLDYTENLPWSSMVFYKGRDYGEEIKKVDMPLKVVIYDLYKESEESFYQGKVLIEISKQK